MDRTTRSLSPAEQLAGLTLEGGWTVVRPVARFEQATGGHFSQGYVVENDDGRQGFLKALDYSVALEAEDPALELQAMTESFNFERNLLHRCRAKNLGRVALPLADGTLRVDHPVPVVQYIIFEAASGDLRKHIALAESFTFAWALRCLHNLAVGLKQLHGLGIAHQDLKPSNALVFADRETRIADLGRAAVRGEKPPHHDCDCAGDRGYAPPELLYGQVSPEWNVRRFGCDIYLLGSMAVFLFTGLSATSLLTSHLEERLRWTRWGGTYEEVLPYLRSAFYELLADFRSCIPAMVLHWRGPDYKDELEATVRQLCEPDPTLRGHPRSRFLRGNSYSLERYVSKFDLLAKHAEYSLIKIQAG